MRFGVKWGRKWGTKWGKKKRDNVTSLIVDIFGEIEGISPSAPIQLSVLVPLVPLLVNKSHVRLSLQKHLHKSALLT